jgi:membrane associated rhomboid family serine protease
MMQHERGGSDRPRNPIFNVPTSVLIALGVLVVVYVGLNLLPWEERLRLLLTLAFIPARYSAGAAELPGGSIADVTSFGTYMLVHGSAVHLLVNGLWMLAFGSAVAKRLGSNRFFAFTLFCGVAAAFAHLLVHLGEAVPVVGASGAVSGHMAGAIRFLFSARGPAFGPNTDLASQPLASLQQTFTDRRILAFLAVWTVVNLMFGIGDVRLEGAGGGIAWVAHMGGFAAGLLGIGLFDRRSPAAPQRSSLQ